MKASEVTTQDFVLSHGDILGLQWQAGETGKNRLLLTKKFSMGTSIAGYLNLVKPNLIQVLGPEEVQYLKQLGKNSHKDAIDRLCSAKPAMIIFSDISNSNQISNEFISIANKSGSPLFSSHLSSDKLIELLQYHLPRLLGESQILHGVFMEVMGIGVLLTGASGIGKSELALELLSRGHRLIADDAPEFRRSAPDTIHGRCPAILKDFLEVRGLGILNVRAMFGDTAIVESKRLRLIVHLDKMSDKNTWAVDRIGNSKLKHTILEVEITKVELPVAPGRNLAVLIEAAVRNHVLSLNGYSAAEDFILRQKESLKGD